MIQKLIFLILFPVTLFAQTNEPEYKSNETREIIQKMINEKYDDEKNATLNN